MRPIVGLPRCAKLIAGERVSFEEGDVLSMANHAALHTGLTDPRVPPKPRAAEAAGGHRGQNRWG
jgi:hypothetical protein